MRGHTLISTVDFRGLYDRGLTEAVPPEYCSICSNVMFSEREVLSRYGTSLSSITISGIRRIALYKRPGEATRLLILNSSGQLYDSTKPSPILEIAQMADFRMYVFFGRAYITPLGSDGRGLDNNFIYVYNGTGVARLAAGDRPVGTLTATESPGSGNVTAGFHLYAVAYETDSGFITKPGPANYALLESSGNKAVVLAGIPTGPAGTTKRHILATKAIFSYDGNQEGYEFFFVPNGTINNNNPVGQYEINFFDSALIASAEHLFDQYERIPASTGIAEYRGRMMLWQDNYIFVSRPGEPESIDALSGLVLIGPGEPSIIQDCVEYRDMFYVLKKYRAFVAVDNGLDPSTWPVNSVDKGVGSPLRGIIQVMDAQGTSVDKFLVATYRGLVLFDGIFREPELSYNIEAIWHRINKNYFHLVHGVVDTVHHKIYVAVPLDSATDCSHILVADFSRGLDPVNIRWSIWSSGVWQPRSITLDLAQDTPYLRIGSSTGVYDANTSSNSDAGQVITSMIQTGFLPFGSGIVQHFTGTRMLLRGSGTANIQFTNEVTSSAALSRTLTANPQDLVVLSNFIAERCAVNLTVNSAGDWFSLNRLDLFYKPLWLSRPNA